MRVARGLLAFMDHLGSMSSEGSKTVRPAISAEPGTLNQPVLSSVAADFSLLVATESSFSATRLEPGTVYMIGRAQDADIIVNDPSVSRLHAKLTVGSDIVTIEDLGSSNGTRVDGVLVAAGRGIPCRVGGSIELASVTLLLQRRRGAATGVGPRLIPVTQPVVEDPTMKQIYAMLDLVAPTTLNVLVLGETGVGKEIFVQAVHERSSRARAPLLEINAAALPPSMLEAELFGFEKGAFTGATVAKPGLFEAADGGTVFLDEIGDMPLPTQVKILRVLESGKTMRIGSVRPRQVDVRVVAATNRDLAAAIAAGEFRSDLYYRLNGITFVIPPLRARVSEIGPLAKRFAELAASRLGRPQPTIGPDVISLLERRPWRGNVRELRNAVDRAVVLAGGGEGTELRPEHFPADTFVGLPSASSQPPMTNLLPPPPDRQSFVFPAERESQPSRSSLASLAAPTAPDFGMLEARDSFGLTNEVRELERRRILAALEATGGNQSQAARELGITRGVLLNRLKAFGITPRARDRSR